MDHAGRCYVFTVVDGVLTDRQDVVLQAGLSGRARQLVELGVDQLICGALSCRLMDLLDAGGVAVTANICGDVEQVLQAFIEKRLTDDQFLMPGCCGRRRHFRRRRHGSGCGRQGQP
jgi:predicted Fe-Mo cluster-binding NifX family protein